MHTSRVVLLKVPTRPSPEVCIVIYQPHLFIAQDCNSGINIGFPLRFQEVNRSPEFQYLRPSWTTPADFLDRCGEFDGSEHLVGSNVSYTSSLIGPLAPLFQQGLTFDSAVSALDAYSAAKSDFRGSRTGGKPHTCLPWEFLNVAVSNRPLRIAMFTTATRNSKDLFGNVYNGDQQMTYNHAYNLSLNDKVQYCARHGYGWHVFEDVIEGRSVGWNRMPAALSLLSRYDWVFHIDLDSLIMDHSIRLEEFLDPRYDLVIGVDMNGINHGVFSLRNSTWSRMLYAEAWTRTKVPHSEYWFEQAALMAIMADGYGVRNHIKLVPQEHFNTYLGPGDALPAHSPEPFVLHFPGRGDKWELVENFWGERKNVL